MMTQHDNDYRATTTTTTKRTPLVWMGSADHARLHSYEIAMSNNNDEKDDENGVEQAHDDDDRGVVLQLCHDQEFPASVLAIASHADGQKLVVATQDGCIVILQLYSGDDDDDETTGTKTSRRRRLVTEATVIIDGPILALSYHQNGTIIIGSLCGYVARMKDDGTQLELIVEGLTTAAAAGGHNSNNSADDAVLAVDASSSGARIWVGTRSGRCLLYHHYHHRHDDERSGGGEKIMRWQLVWQVRLPYAVHGIWDDNDHGTVAVAAGQQPPRVIVTTTRGVHVFRTVQSAVQRARSRLTDLIIKSKSNSGHPPGQ
jgi:hypothetical protein